MADYFANRRKQLGLQPSGGSSSSSAANPKRAGFSLDDQADFAEEQMAMALAASDVVQDATALFVIGACARLAHVLEARDFSDLRAKEMAGAWQFSRYFRSV